MFNIGKILLLITLASAATLTACNKTTTPKTTDTADSKVALLVNGTPISSAMLDAYAKQRAAARPDEGTAPDRMGVIDEMVTREVIYQDALAQGLDKKPEVIAELENLKRNVLANVVIRHYLETNTPTDEAVKKEYDASVGKLSPKEYKAKHILVKTEQEAKDIIAQLDKGDNFANLAKEKSMDTASGKEGGDLGWFDSSQMVKPFADATAALEKGKYGQSPTQSEFGWHVILLEDTRAKAAPSFDQVKENVRGALRNKQIKDYLDQLKAKAKVEIKDNPTNSAAGNSTVPAPEQNKEPMPGQGAQ